MAGPRRRAAIARAATRSGVRVRAVPGGWTVTAPTGRVVVTRTLDGLLDAVGPDDREAARAALLTAAGAPDASGV